jgi:beta-phosphoglucomutase-like phosphatase (HAD superfamily)
MLKIRELQNKLTNTKERLEDAEKRMQEAEDDASEKDKLLNEAIERMRQYEAVGVILGMGAHYKNGALHVGR